MFRSPAWSSSLYRICVQFRTETCYAITNPSRKAVYVEHLLKALVICWFIRLSYIDPRRAEVFPPALTVLTDLMIGQQIVSHANAVLFFSQFLNLHHFISILMLIHRFYKVRRKPLVDLVKSCDCMASGFRLKTCPISVNHNGMSQSPCVIAWNDWTRPLKHEERLLPPQVC